MKRKFAAVLILTVALLGQAIASVLPSACVHAGQGAGAEMSMEGMNMHSDKGAGMECDCCPSSSGDCTLAGCFSSVLPPSAQLAGAPTPQLPGADALIFQIPPIPLSSLFRPPIA